MDPRLVNAFRPRLNEFIRHSPHPKQIVFLNIQSREALYGGAAGGGKSDALLMAALQYVDIPGYAAILFRRTYSDLALAGALIPRSHEWLQGTGARWAGGGISHGWRFPSGARIDFGYLRHSKDKYRYASSEYAFIGFDELTQFPEDDYTFMFSRLRKPIKAESPLLAQVPLRMRAATNPGSIGHLWVKKRFSIKKKKSPSGKDYYGGDDPKRPFVPALVQDNPNINEREYAKSLSELDPITREQLKLGDWGVTAEGHFRSHWARRYITRGDYILCQPQVGASCRIAQAEDFGKWIRFISIDPAASERNSADPTAIGSFAYCPETYRLVVLDMQQKKIPIPELPKFARSIMQRDHSLYALCEAQGIGLAAYQTMLKAGITTVAVPAIEDKLHRATEAMLRMERSQVFFPDEQYDWLEAFEAELYTWTADPAEPDNRIDAFAHAAAHVGHKAIISGAETMIPTTPSIHGSDNSPEVYQ